LSKSDARTSDEQLGISVARDLLRESCCYASCRQPFMIANAVAISLREF
jgi:hypothetical protein